MGISQKKNISLRLCAVQYDNDSITLKTFAHGLSLRKFNWCMEKGLGGKRLNNVCFLIIQLHDTYTICGVILPHGDPL